MFGDIGTTSILGAATRGRYEADQVSISKPLDGPCLWETHLRLNEAEDGGVYSDSITIPQFLAMDWTAILDALHRVAGNSFVAGVIVKTATASEGPEIFKRLARAKSDGQMDVFSG